MGGILLVLLRYIDPKNSEQLIDLRKAYWENVLYWRSKRHALLYARFWHHVSMEGGWSQPEPFKKLFHQGIILEEDGEKMSANIVNLVIIGATEPTPSVCANVPEPLEAMKPGTDRRDCSLFKKTLAHLIIDNEGTLNRRLIE